MKINHSIDFKRKKPSQGRSRQTIETIIDTAAQILTDDDGTYLTTNYLAQRSGYSVGTIYQYFSNREGIILALIERQRMEVERQINIVLEDSRFDSPQDKTKAIIHLLHEAFSRYRQTTPRLIRTLIDFSLDHGMLEPSQHFVNAILTVWSETEDYQFQFNEAETFVLSRSVLEVLRAATLQSYPLLGTEEFENAILRLINGFFRIKGS